MKPPQGPTDESNAHWKPNMDNLYGEGWSARHGIDQDSGTEAIEPEPSFTEMIRAIQGGRPLELDDIVGIEITAKRSSGAIEDDHRITDMYMYNGKQMVETINPQGVRRRMGLESVVNRNLDMSQVTAGADRKMHIPDNVRVAMLIEAELQRQHEAESAANADTIPREQLIAARTAEEAQAALAEPVSGSERVSIEKADLIDAGIGVEHGPPSPSERQRAEHPVVAEQPQVPTEVSIDRNPEVVIDRAAFAAAFEAAAETGSDAEVVTAGSIIENQIAELAEGRGTEVVVPFETPVEEMGQVAGSAEFSENGDLISNEVGVPDVEQEPAEEAASVETEAQPEYMEWEELTQNHFKDIMNGNVDIEGADPQMVGDLEAAINRMRNNLEDALSEAGSHSIVESLHQKVVEMVGNGAEISNVEHMLTKTIHQLGEFIEAARSFGNFMQYDGNPDFARGYSMRFIEAAARLGIAGYGAPAQTEMGVLMTGQAFEPIKALARDVELAAESANDEYVRSPEAQLQLDRSELNDRLAQMFAEAGNDVDRLNREIYDMFPDGRAVSVRSRIGQVEELGVAIRTAGKVVDIERTGGYMDYDMPNAFQNLVNEVQIASDSLNAGQLRNVDGQQIAYKAETILRSLDAMRNATVRARYAIQNELGY